MALEDQPVAFATREDGIQTRDNAEGNRHLDQDLVVATSRCPFYAKDGTLLNVECFGPSYHHVKGVSCATDESDESIDTDEWPLLLYVHGICESAETVGVQTLAQNCPRHKWRLVVLELAGHGLSGDVIATSRGGRAVCPNFDGLVDHVVEFTIKMRSKFSKAKGMVLAGGSLGGALIAYSVSDILKAAHNDQHQSDKNNNTQQQQPQHSLTYPEFYGIVMLAPALGIHPDAIPPLPVVMALRALSCLVPSRGILTPIEYPEHYACPSNSKRNFSGHWPLSTSSMLLDVTAKQIPNDIASGQVSKQMEGLSSLLVIAGNKDEIVPLENVQRWFDAVSNLSCENGSKKLVVLQGAGHGFFHERRGRELSKAFLQDLFTWLKGRRAHHQ